MYSLQALWGSWTMIGQTKRIFFAGDTGIIFVVYITFNDTFITFLKDIVQLLKK